MALTLALLAVLVMQIWAGVALRGLYADGAYYAEQLLLRASFVVIEPSRRTSQILMQIPVVLAMRLGWDSPHAVALAFSLATNLMPLVLTLACLAVLPPEDRAWGLFPVFVFLAASMSAAVASVADGPTAAAYAWLLLILVLFGPLTRLRLAAILLLAAGAVRLHEAMAFLGPILAFACLSRLRAAPGRIAPLVLTLAALMAAAGCVAGIGGVLHPRLLANRTSFITDVVSLRWLRPGTGQVSVTALAGLLALLALPLAAIGQRRRAVAMAGLLVLFIALAVLAWGESACPPAAFAARNNACLLTAPAMALLLMLRRHRTPPQPSAVVITAMLGLAVAAADGAATASWLGYTGRMRAVLASEHGVVTWTDALARLSPAQAETLKRFSWPWTTPLMSLWLAPGPLGAVIANPAGVVWQPFDPDAMKSRLFTGDTPPTRAGFVALLNR